MGNIIYIASPYSNQEPKVMEKNFQLVSELAAGLCSEGHVAFSPITYGHTLLNYKDMPTDWPFWENFCISFLKASSELWVYEIDGWERSRGVAQEIKFAVENNIPVRYIKPRKNI